MCLTSDSWDGRFPIYSPISCCDYCCCHSYKISVNSKRKNSYLQLLFFSDVPTLVFIQRFVRASFRQATGVSISDETLKICLSWWDDIFPVSVALHSPRLLCNKPGCLECQSTCFSVHHPKPSDPFCCLLEPVQSVIYIPGLTYRSMVVRWGEGLLSKWWECTPAFLTQQTFKQDKD